MAIDASLIEADANKQNSTPKEDWDAASIDPAGRNAAKKVELEGYSPRITIAEMDVTSDPSVAEGSAQAGGTAVSPA